MKDKFINIRVTEEEKAEMKQRVKDNGLNSISALIMWMYRKFTKTSE